MIVLAFAGGCREREEINTNITPVGVFFAPEDNRFVKLQPTTSASVLFEWEQARAEDGTLVLYEVAFDKEAGDFSAPVFKLTSDNNGVMNRLTLSHKDLNRIGALAGIASLATGKLKWTVLASKGINVQKSAASRLLQVERPAGFADVPVALFLTGAATEAGTDLAKSTPFKQTGAGVFELYTSLKPGAYRLTDRADGSPNAKSYFFDGQLLKEGTTGASPVASGSKVYRLVMDFNNAAATLTEIVSVGLWFSPQQKVTVTLPYTSNSTWKVENTPIEFFQESWGRDERYKFRFTVKGADGAEAAEFFGSVNADNQRPGSGTAPAFYHLVPVNSAPYDFTFKFRSEVDRSNADVSVIMQSTAPYTHVVAVR